MTTHRITVGEELRTNTDTDNARSTHGATGPTGPAGATGATGPRGVTGSTGPLPGPAVTVTGSKGANAALTSLLAGLVTLGLIVDSTS